MKYAFIITGKMYLKFYINIIQEILNYNEDVILIFDYSKDRNLGKWREFPFLGIYNNDNKKLKKKVIYSHSEIISILNSENIDYVFSLSSLKHYKIDKQAIKSKWVMLQSGVDVYHYSEMLDGTGFGLDLNLIKFIKDFKKPIILSGGLGKKEHFLDCLKNYSVDAVSTANLLNFLGSALYDVRKFLYKNNLKLANWKF